MPYASQAQRGKFHILEKQGKISKKEVDKWDKASKGLDLPKHKGDDFTGGYDRITKHMKKGGK